MRRSPPVRPLRNLYDFRDVVWTLSIRETLIRYRTMWFGALWTVAPALGLLAAFSLVFATAFEDLTGGVPYPLFALAGLVPWVYTAAVVSRSASCLIGNAELVTRVYIPREVFPIVALGSRAIDFAIGMAILLGAAAWYGTLSVAALLHLPAVVLVHVVLLAAVALPIAVLAVPVRDLTYVINYAVQIGMIVTPVFWPVELLSPNRRLLVHLNPMTSILEAYRDVLLRGASPWTVPFVGVAFASVLLFVLSYAAFKRIEGRVVEIL